MSPASVVSVLRRINDRIAVVVGGVLLAGVAMIFVEVVLRRLGLAALGGTDEISGYIMAAATSWGLAYALTTLAHVRIDLLRQKAPSPVRAVLDLLALGALAGVALAVAWKGWAVVARSIGNASRANTPLETPLWIPQALWWSGWLWFAVAACALWLAAAALLIGGDQAAAERAVGTGSEREDAV